MAETYSIYQSVDTEAYISACFPLTSEEVSIKSQALELVPDSIIDIHSHTGLPTHATNLHPRFYTDLISTFPYFTIPQHKEVDLKLWGNHKAVQHALFAFPFEGMDVTGVNKYIGTIDDQLVIPLFTSDEKHLEQSKEGLLSGDWRGVKAYYRQNYPEAKTISEFYTPEIMEVIDNKHLLLILHLPNDLQTDSDELLFLLKKYRQANFVIAHMGFPDDKDPTGFKYILDQLKLYANIFFESSWSFNADAMSSVIEILGSERLLYGSDQPLNLIRASVVNHPKLGARVAVGIPYHWADPEEQRYYNDNLINMSSIATIHFQSLKAILVATGKQITDMSQQRELLRKVFYENSHYLLSGS